MNRLKMRVGKMHSSAVLFCCLIIYNRSVWEERQGITVALEQYPLCFS